MLSNLSFFKDRKEMSLAVYTTIISFYHHQPMAVYCWTHASPIARHFGLFLATKSASFFNFFYFTATLVLTIYPAKRVIKEQIKDTKNILTTLIFGLHKVFNP